jgi:SulP family sulfate permease
MKQNTFQFNIMEFSGSLGDLGTLIPLSLGLIMMCGLSTSTVFVMIGLFYVITGLFFKLPLPVQPLKVVAAISLANPSQVTPEIIAGAGLAFGIILLFLGTTGMIDPIAKLFKKSVIRGIQLGLGLILIQKGLTFIMNPAIFNWQTTSILFLDRIPVNLTVSIIMIAMTLFFFNSRRVPAALIIVSMGIILGLMFGGLKNVSLEVGSTGLSYVLPDYQNIITALFLLVIPQIPLTIGNAVIGTSDTCVSLFGTNEKTKKVTYRSLANSMGITNIFVGLFAGMPMCHGAGGLAAHYRFGARTGGSNIMIGSIFIISGLFFGKLSFALLNCLPNAVFGTLLLFAGLELAVLIRDLNDKNDVFVAMLIAGIAIRTNNMGVAFISGMLVERLIQWIKIEL